MVRRAAMSILTAVVTLAGCSKESPGDPCDGVACSARGFCVTDGHSPYCSCLRGYHPRGLECLPNDATDPCLDVDCNEHGTCVEDDGFPLCDCETGFHLEGTTLCLPGAADADADADVPDVEDDSSAEAEAEADVGDEDFEEAEAEAGAEIGDPCTTDPECATGGLACAERLGECVYADCAGQADFEPCETVTDPDRWYDICIDGTCVSPGCGDRTCNPSGPHFPITDTGQGPSSCYDGAAWMMCPGTAGDPSCATTPFCGQDAQYGWDLDNDAATDRFESTTVGSDRIATDAVTGLVWQGCPGGLSDSGCATGTVSAIGVVGALSYCDGLTWAGTDDWRLPDAWELQTLVNHEPLGGPRTYVTAFSAVPESWFWTSSASYRTDRFWSVNFGSGEVGMMDVESPYHVRCVRGVARPRPGPRFVRTEGATDQYVVTDAFTGLVWQGCPDGTDTADCINTSLDRTWEQALAWCESLDWGGETDWRLPNVMELRTIVDLRRNSPSIDPAVFPSTPGDLFWTSTTAASATGYAWFVRFDYGHSSWDLKGMHNHVRCVRGGS